jgi:pilin isopeptide linkage protein
LLGFNQSLTEVKGDDEQIAYDEAEYAYEVTLQDNGEGGITAQITAGEDTTFVNSYYEPQKPHEPTEPTGTKPQKPKQNPAEPQTVQKTRTGDYIKLALPFVALAAAAGIMIFLFATRRRREE